MSKQHTQSKNWSISDVWRVCL